jgi:hypothetical protein
VTAGDYALLALFRLGGSSQDVDVEDVTIEAFRLAPSLFSWRRHPELPSIEAVRIGFRNLEKAHRAHYVISSKGHERMLTAQGIKRAQDVAELLDRRGDSPSPGDALRRPIHRDLARMLAHPAYAGWQEKGAGGLDRLDLGDLIRVVSGSPASAYTDALLRAQSQATDAGQNDLAAFLADCLVHVDEILARTAI